MINVREARANDIQAIADYWTNGDPEFLKSMGVDVNLLPSKSDIHKNLLAQLELPLDQRRSYCLIWEIDGKPVGHCNTNPSYFGREAWMHLHLWHLDNRKKGMGMELVQKSIPFFFERLQLQKLISTPYALNAAPNKTLEKAGFKFQREYVTVPGSLNFEQPVNEWVMTRGDYRILFS